MYENPVDRLEHDESRIEALGLKKGLTAKLISAGYFKVWPLVSNLKAGVRLTDIPGIGPEAAGQIADALADFRKKKGY